MMTAAPKRITNVILMIVEDDALVAMVLNDVLEDAGYKVVDLTDRQDAALQIAQAEKHHLALLNISRAGGDDGIELSERLKAIATSVVRVCRATRPDRGSPTPLQFRPSDFATKRGARY